MKFLKLMVCPHDTANNPERWYLLAQYLSARLKARIRFEIALDFQEFHQNLAQADLVYANPQDTLKLIEQKGFIPLAKPKGIYDEVVFITSRERLNPSLKAIQGERVASVVSMLPTKLALHILQKHSITPAEVINRDSWLAVVNSVLRGEVNYAFLYDGTYHEFSEYSKEMINAFFFSEEKLAFHSLNISPKLSDKRADIERVMLGMAGEPKGRELLEALEMESWQPVEMKEFMTLKKLRATYS